jgi:hypothetical protein
MLKKHFSDLIDKVGRIVDTASVVQIAVFHTFIGMIAAFMLLFSSLGSALLLAGVAIMNMSYGYSLLDATNAGNRPSE